METAKRDFAPEMFRGMTQFALFGVMTEEFALQLGVSTWMRRSGAGLGSLRQAMLDMRDALVEVGNLDSHTEPVPLLGRSERDDALNLAGYLCILVRRAASSARCEPVVICERAVDHLRRHAPAPGEDERATG